MHYHTIGLALNPSLDHKANNAERAIIMLQGTAGDVDPTLNDFLYYLIKCYMRRLSFYQTLHPKGDPGTATGIESWCLGVKPCLRK